MIHYVLFSKSQQTERIWRQPSFVNAFAPWKILHLELSEGIPALPFGSDYQGLYIVFWWRGIPLGHLEIQAAQLPMPATQLANLVLQTITPAVGDRLFEQGFKAPLPELPKKIQFLQTLMHYWNWSDPWLSSMNAGHSLQVNLFPWLSVRGIDQND